MTKQLNKGQGAIKAAKVIRYLTVAPVLVLVLAITVSLGAKEVSGKHFLWLALLFLSLFPIAAYPIYRNLKLFEPRSRAKERSFAIIISFAGYIFALVLSLLLKAGQFSYAVFITYFLSVCIIGFSSKVLKFNASGHACGVTGPAAILYYLFGKIALIFIPVIIAVFWSSLKLKRHTLSQLAAGSIVPIAVFFIIRTIML